MWETIQDSWSMRNHKQMQLNTVSRHFKMAATPLYPEKNINSVLTLTRLVSIATSDQLKMRGNTNQLLGK